MMQDIILINYKTCHDIMTIFSMEFEVIEIQSQIRFAYFVT
jgi:hypothetical protein